MNKGTTLAQAYVFKATKRLRVLAVLLEEESYSDVVREAQELVELALKGLLREFGIDPPRQHDVGGLVVEYAHRLPSSVAPEAERLAAISRRLRKERELAFYGDVDFIPTLEYSEADGRQALADAEYVVAAVRRAVRV
ncbi:MAG: HEPN domain-containing protein [bacterium]|nr:HEPN domain-containing protein [bacterium]